MEEPVRVARQWVPVVVSVIVLVTPAVTVVLDASGVVRVVSGGLPVDIATFADIVGLFGSVVSTLALVVLYREQTEIQRRQEEWMEAEHVPDVFVHEWEVTQNRVRLVLSNLGTGVAQNLRAEVGVESADEYGLSSVRFVARVSRPSSSARTLRPGGDEAVEHTGRFERQAAHGTVDADRLSVDQTLTWLSGEKSPVDIVVRLEYDYVRRRSGTQPVFSAVADLGGASTVEEVLLSTNPRSTDQPATPPDNLTESKETLSPKRRYDEP